ncbi:MAG: PilZ domain-containing protein [Candidatus Omnitrophota bacterium]
MLRTFNKKLVFGVSLVYIMLIMVWEGINKRKFPRVSYKCLIRVTEEGVEDVIETFTENIGSGGICVVLEKRLGLFEKVFMQIFIEEGTNQIECRGAVVWVVKRSNSSLAGEAYDTGIEFQDLKVEDRKRIGALVDDILESET